MLTRLVLTLIGFGFFSALVLGIEPPNFVEITLESMLIPADLGEGNLQFFLKDTPVRHHGMDAVFFEKGNGFIRSISDSQIFYNSKSGGKMKICLYLNKTEYDQISISNSSPIKIVIKLEGEKVHEREYSKSNRKICIHGKEP